MPPQGKAASEKKAQHEKKTQKTHFSLVFLFGSKKFITEQVLRVERRAATNPKGSTWLIVSEKKTLRKLITGGLAKVFNPSNGKRETTVKILYTESILFLAVLLFPLFSILDPAGRDKEVGYGGFTW